MSRRPSVSIYNYPEALNPFNDDSPPAAPQQPNGELKHPLKEPKHKFWTFGRSKKKRSNSFSIKSTWNGLFGKRKDSQEVELRKPTIATVSSTYKRGTYNGYPVAAPRLSSDQREFDEALGTLARRRKYTLDNTSRYGSSLTMNGDSGRIYEGVPQETTTSIIGELTPKPPARRFGQVSPKPTDKIPPLDYSGREKRSNGGLPQEEDIEHTSRTPVPPKRGGPRASQRSIASSPFNDDESPADRSLRDENENVPEDYVFARCSHDPTRRSNISINSCMSVGSTMSTYGRKKRRAPQPPRLKEPLETPKEIETRLQEPNSPEEAAERLETAESIARVTENIAEMTKRSQELVEEHSGIKNEGGPEEPKENSPAESEKNREVAEHQRGPQDSQNGDDPPEEKSERASSERSPTPEVLEDQPSALAEGSCPSEMTKPPRKSIERQQKSNLSAEKCPEGSLGAAEVTEPEVEVELRRKPSSDRIEITKEVLGGSESDLRGSGLVGSFGSLSRSDSFSVKDVIDSIERKIKYLEAQEAKKEETSEIFERCSSRLSLRETRSHFFRNMVDESGVKVEMRELPREQNDIKIVRLEDPPVEVEGPTEPVRVVELHISEPVKQKPTIFCEREVNPIPKPRRHSNLGLDGREKGSGEEEGRRGDEEHEKRGSSL